MSNPLFISETFLKDATPITKNVDVSELLPFVVEAQDLYIQPALGSKLYVSLQAAVTANTFSADQIVLLKLIRKSLAWYINYEAIPFLQTKLRNKGVLKASGENLENASFQDVVYLRNEAKSKAEFYMQRVKDYLCENGSLFPEYTNPDSLMPPSKSTNYSCDLAFEKPSCNRDYTKGDIL